LSVKERALGNPRRERGQNLQRSVVRKPWKKNLKKEALGQKVPGEKRKQGGGTVVPE